MRPGARAMQRRKIGAAALALGLLVVHLCLPGLQASMLRLAPAPVIQAGHEGHGDHHHAPAEGEAGKAAFACAICAAALLPGAATDFAAVSAPSFSGRAAATRAAAGALREQARAAPFARGPPALS